MGEQSMFSWLTPFAQKRESLQLLNPLWRDKHQNTNQQDIDYILKVLEAMSRKQCNSSPEESHQEDETDVVECNEALRKGVFHYMPDLLLLYQNATNVDTRESVENILRRLETLGFSFPSALQDSPSVFIAAYEFGFLAKPFQMFSESKKSVHKHFTSRFDRRGRVENFVQVLAMHPEFLDSYINLHSFLLESEACMSFADRYFVAILAAVQMRCPYLVYLFARDFIRYGGSNAWLSSPDQVSAKLKKLIPINTKLATEPWNLQPQDIDGLNRGQGAFSLTEMMFVLCIMTHVQALACFIFATGVTPEVDHPGGCSYTKVSANTVEVALSNGQAQSQQQPGQENSADLAADLVAKLQPFTEEDEVDADKVQELFEQLVKQNNEMDRRWPPETGVLKRYNAHLSLQGFLALQQTPDQGYSAFHGQPFNFQNFPWFNEAQAEINQIHEDLGSRLGQNFKNAYELTYNMVNEMSNVDTSAYRQTVWNTVQSFFGIVHDDFSYDRIGLFLTDQQRVFLKRCSTRPWEIDYRLDLYNYADLMPALKPSEVVHVMLMLMEARRQACLLYAVYAISEHRKH